MEENYLSIEDAESTLLSAIANELGFQYLKSKKSLKKVIKDLVFVIDFYMCKWNKVGDKIEVNAGFHIYNKKYGKLPAESVVASKMYKPRDKEWYDITSEEKLSEVIKELSNTLKDEVLGLFLRFEKDYDEAVEFLLREKFEEFNVYLDFVADTLGEYTILQQAEQISSVFSDDIRVQIEEYRKGVRNKKWMLNRSNIKYIVDNNLA